MRMNLFVPFAIVLMAWPAVATPEFIAPPVEGHVHASTFVPVGTNGDCFAAWFEGTHERADDVAIFGARRRGGVWLPKRRLAKVMPNVAHWNPVLRRADDGRLLLYFKVGRDCSHWCSWVQESRDDGETWTAAEELVPNDVQGGRGPVRNKCLRLKSGRWLAPASWEIGRWRSFVDISDDDGRTWRASPTFPMPDADEKGVGVIQPTLWEDASGVHALLRATDGWVWRSDSKDGGETWCEIYRSPLENVNSGIDCVRASNGCIYLVLNGRDPSAGKDWKWGTRNHLEIRVSADGGASWSLFRVLADDDVRQADGRKTEFSYPAIRELRSGVLAVTYTYNRRQIAFEEIPIGRPDVLRATPLGKVRLNGFVGKKVDAVIRERMTSDFARNQTVREAREVFERRDDDPSKGYGQWRGEFWGKLMLAASRAAEYAHDAALRAFVLEEARKIVATQDDDGYVGSYADKGFVSMRDKKPSDWKAYGWPSNWNLWCRKYAMWGLLRIWALTGERALLDSAARQMDQWIGMLHAKGLSLRETGNPNISGLASMSVLKPLMILYRATGNAAYLDYAREIVADWDREDGERPNIIRNGLSGIPVHDWYAKPRAWAKAYEMMSGMDGLLDYVRQTGDERVFTAMRMLTESIRRDELNVFGGVGYNAMFIDAAHQINAMSEICDTVHWIKLNQTLFLMTGESRYADAMELAFYNELLAGCYRDGKWAAAAVRDKCRNMTHDGQVGLKNNHCCVDNLPRAFFDFAETVLSADSSGAVQVNFYSDCRAELNGVRVEITGGYPVSDVVRVRVDNPKGVPVRFRKPGWCERMDVSGETDVTIRFAMPPRLICRDLPSVVEWMPNRTDPRLMRYVVPWEPEANADVISRLRKTPGAALMRGPLLLAKSVRVGDTVRQIFDPRTVNGGGWAVRLERMACEDVVGAWRATFTRGAESHSVNVCDFASAADTWYLVGADAFNVWF